MKTINITWKDGAYYASEPNWNGGEVVMASELDLLRASNAALLAACKLVLKRWPDYADHPIGKDLKAAIRQAEEKP